MEDWEPIARHGDTAAEVRAGLEEVQAAAIVQWEREQIADGLLPAEVIDAAVRLQTDLAAPALDALVVGVMDGMALSAGAERLH